MYLPTIFVFFCSIYLSNAGKEITLTARTGIQLKVDLRNRLYGQALTCDLYHKLNQLNQTIQNGTLLQWNYLSKNNTIQEQINKSYLPEWITTEKYTAGKKNTCSFKIKEFTDNFFGKWILNQISLHNETGFNIREQVIINIVPRNMSDNGMPNVPFKEIEILGEIGKPLKIDIEKIPGEKKGYCFLKQVNDKSLKFIKNLQSSWSFSSASSDDNPSSFSWLLTKEYSSDENDSCSFETKNFTSNLFRKWSLVQTNIVQVEHIIINIIEK